MTPRRADPPGRAAWPDEPPRLLAECLSRRLLVSVEVDASPGREEPCGNGSAAAGRAGTGGRRSSRRPTRRAAPDVRGSAVVAARDQPASPDRAAVSRLDPPDRPREARRPERRRRRSARRRGPPVRGGPGADRNEHERDRRHDEESQRCESVPSHEVTARWRSSGASGLLAERPQLVPNLFECADRGLLHRRVDVVVRELSLCEERGQAAVRNRRRARGCRAHARGTRRGSPTGHGRCRWRPGSSPGAHTRR